MSEDPVLETRRKVFEARSKENERSIADIIEQMYGILDWRVKLKEVKRCSNCTHCHRDSQHTESDEEVWQFCELYKCNVDEEEIGCDKWGGRE